MNGLRMSEKFQQHLDVFRKSDAERDAVFQELITKYEQLELELHNTRQDHENELTSRRHWQGQALKFQRDLEAEQVATESCPFVLAVIDGDGAIFNEDLYKAVAEGGTDAAHRLYQEIRSHIVQQYPKANTADWNVVVHIYYNMEGLSHKLRYLGILANSNEMAPFARSFSLHQPLFNLIDVGSGKERADYKIREMLRLFLPNLQCRHIIFGGCHDNGYLPALDPYKRDPRYSSRISLLETLPMQPGFIQLGFPTIRFPTVFRAEPLPDRLSNPVPAPTLQTLPVRSATTRPGSFAVSSPVYESPPVKLSSQTRATNGTSPSVESASASSWAKVGKAGVSQRSIDIAPKKSAPARKFIVLNVNEDRLDAELPRADANAKRRFYERHNTDKVCNNYHLNGKCENGSYCDFDHGEKLDPGMLLALKHQARQRSCPVKPNMGYCRDFDCTNGHVCPFKSACNSGNNCWFAHTHNIDLEPAVRIYEDGEEEWLKKFI